MTTGTLTRVQSPDRDKCLECPGVIYERRKCLVLVFETTKVTCMTTVLLRLIGVFCAPAICTGCFRRPSSRLSLPTGRRIDLTLRGRPKRWVV